MDNFNHNITIGCDPELFLKQGSRFIPAVGIVPGSKKTPHEVKWGSVQVDGLALEIGIVPTASAHSFVRNISAVLADLYSMIPSDLQMVDAASAVFDEELMAALPAASLALGCEPDYNAYTGAENPPPISDGNWRSAGGHIHVGWTEDQDIDDPGHFDICQTLARNMDIFLGCASISEDIDRRRREMYGKAGAFRPKPYGMEYRTLSNYWLFNPELQAAVFYRTKHAWSNMIGDEHGPDWVEVLGAKHGMPLAQYAIDTSDMKAATDIAMRIGVGIVAKERDVGIDPEYGDDDLVPDVDDEYVGGEP